MFKRFKRFVLVFPLMLLMAASALVVASPAYADLGLRETPDSTWMTNGNVYATAVSEDGETLYIGGKFKQVREKPAGQGGRVVAVNNVAAIDMDTGAAISSWKPAVTSSASSLSVRSLAVKNGQVYIGGNFTAVDGQPRQNLAAVNATTGAVSAFNPTVGDGTSFVYSILPGTSKVYIGGKFARVGGTGRGNIAAVNPTTGALDPTWSPRTNKLVRDLAFDSAGATVFAMGGFGGDTAVSYGGVNYNRQSVARFDAATGSVHPWAPAPGVIQTDSSRNNTMTCWSATVTPTRLFVNCGLGPNYSVALRLDDGNTGSRAWQIGFVGNPVSSALSPDGSRLIIGGHFGINPLDQQVCGGRYLKGLVAVNPANGAVDCSWIPTLDQKTRPDYDGSWSLLTSGDKVWVGGGFSGVTGAPQTNLARFTYDPNFRAVNYSTPKVDLNGPQRGGLDATFFDNQNFTGTQVSRTDGTVDFDWGNGSPAPGIGPDTFSTRWAGQIEAPASGEYTFTTTADDGVRLFVEGKQVIDNWNDRAPTDDSGTITLEAGKRYDIQLDYYENGGGAVSRLQWSYPGQARQVIPASSLLYSGATSHAATFVAGSGSTAVADPALTVTDADDVNIRSATVTLANRPDGAAESLSAATAGTTIVAGYDAPTGKLNLNGTASKAVYQQVLSSIRYNNTAANPTAGDRQVTFTVYDGFVDSPAATSTVSVQSP